MLSEIDKITDYFTIVTSNLTAQYLYATEAVNESFVIKDCPKVYDSIKQLIDGHGKNNKGSLIKFFDERDKELQNYRLEEEIGLGDWLKIEVVQIRSDFENVVPNK